MIIDILIVLIVFGAGFVGFQKGFIQPLLAEVLFVGSLLVLLDNSDSYLNFMSGAFHANGLLAAFVALLIAGVLGYAGFRLGGIIHRMPSVRGWDGFAGVFVQALVAIVFLYWLFSAMIVLEGVVAPSANNAALTLAQVRNLQKELDSNSLTAQLTRSQDFQALRNRASKPGGGHVTDAAQLNQVVTFYQDLFRPQLASSRLAPWIMRIGEHIPGAGHFGPKDLPKR
jgi:hypothetical protein